MTDVGYFRAKAYIVDPHGHQVWPAGPDVGICVHPDNYRTGNTIYCAFTRMFGPAKTERQAIDPRRESEWRRLDEQGCTVIPPSGKLRDMIRHLPHVFDTLGCRILHLLPVGPTPATYARFGRFGSPYACLDLTAIDPALVEFDRRTTGVDQFCELTEAVHLRGGRILLDIVINHTGWGSTLQEDHPEWFLRDDAGQFVSPGAWGVVWEDLVEIEPRHVALWEELAAALIEWCRRGVDGFRCDAGYKVPVPVWQYLIARVRREFPETLFLLEGLGGSWEATEALLTEGGMQWAYSELFQNHEGEKVANYLDYALSQSERVGTFVHYSETHDNDRLAKRGRVWSLLRNRLCALASVNGAFGFTCGVEWLADEKINVHQSSGLAWDNPENIVPELARLNRLLEEHPCFFDGAELKRLSPPDSPVYALRRVSAEGRDCVLVLVNTDPLHAHSLRLARGLIEMPDTPPDRSFTARPWPDLLGQSPPKTRRTKSDEIEFKFSAGAAFCLSPSERPVGLAGAAYRRARAHVAWAVSAARELLHVEQIGPFDWRALAERIEQDPGRILAALSRVDRELAGMDFPAALDAGVDQHAPVLTWMLRDIRRIVPVPPEHWLLIRDSVPFRARLSISSHSPRLNLESVAAGDGHMAAIPPQSRSAEAMLALERYAERGERVSASLRLLARDPVYRPVLHPAREPLRATTVLLTNGIGGMARLNIDLGSIRSKYDCLLAANLHPSLPVDRHVFAKRARVWVNADGFISALDARNLVAIEAGPPAVWRFVANAGDGRTVEVELTMDMVEGRNTTLLDFRRPSASAARGVQLPDHCDVRLTVRVDIEDRNFHQETKRNPGTEHHFHSHCQALPDSPGFAFTPAADRKLRVHATAGGYHSEEEWSLDLPHSVEASRGMEAAGDAFSPGWFDLPLAKGGHVRLIVTAESEEREREEKASGIRLDRSGKSGAVFPASDSFGTQLLNAARAFVVRRDDGATVIAGYPWFLDWGRDTLICARGLLAAGMTEGVTQLLVTFGRFVDRGTLPNTIHGEDASNRNTSDAPLWYGIVCEEAAETLGGDFHRTPVGGRHEDFSAVLLAIAAGYLRGTPNGIRVDMESALVWSPAHFTWMDTNHPAATPREGYPVEIQVLWIRLLRQLDRLGLPAVGEAWSALADRALDSLNRYYWLEAQGWFADGLIAASGQAAREAIPDTALRSNGLFAVSLGLVTGERARRCVEAARDHLVVPGALRSLAPLPVTPPLPVHAPDGRLLNNPDEPYWGRYEGDEDTRRKPAYHNGTAWTWTFPSFCEALARAWEFEGMAVAAARAYLGSMDRLLEEGCMGQIPEIVDGDAPHGQRGCDAQAWGVTEAVRVWKLLNGV
ncbi:MAG TPA: amylo-alpha-1,6-glucosidase [Methylomirabilota bacterium]|nr:amylo-alpha-1,6-glucosidase [Methylomirabilota bacterium]